MSALLDRRNWKFIYRMASHRSRGILAEIVQDHNWRASPAGIIDTLAAKLPSVRNWKPAKLEGCRENYPRQIVWPWQLAVS